MCLEHVELCHMSGTTSSQGRFNIQSNAVILSEEGSVLMNSKQAMDVIQNASY